MSNKKEMNENKVGSKSNKDFVTSYFAWIELEDQKEIANKLENVTNKKNKK